MWWLRWLDPLFRECRMLGCQEQILCRPPELGLRDTQVGHICCLACWWSEWDCKFFKKGMKFKCFGSHTFSIPVADVEAVARRSTLPFTSYMFRVRDASRWRWTPLRLGAWHRLYLAIHRDDSSRFPECNATIFIVMCRYTIYTPPRRQASSNFEGLQMCIL